jgi:sugar phosphate isomerase/epimerase
MSQLSINELTTYRWSFEEDVDRLAASGIFTIGVWRQKLSDFGEEKGIELLSDKGLRVSSLSWAGGFTGSDGRSFKESVSDALDAVRLAAAMRAASLIVYSGARGGHTSNHARRLLKTALAEVLPVAAECGVTLAVEPMHAGCASDCTFLTSLKEAVELAEEVASPRLKIAFDSYHVGFEPGLLASLPAIVPHIGLVQLGDAKQPPLGEQNRCRLGDGIIPVASIVETLVDCGYCGFFEVELIGEDVESSDYFELLTHSKRAFESWHAAPHVG